MQCRTHGESYSISYRRAWEHLGKTEAKTETDDRPDEGSPVSATGAAGTEPPTTHSVPHSSLSFVLLCVLHHHGRDENDLCLFASNKLQECCSSISSGMAWHWHGAAARHSGQLNQPWDETGFVRDVVPVAPHSELDDWVVLDPWNPTVLPSECCSISTDLEQRSS